MMLTKHTNPDKALHFGSCLGPAMMEACARSHQPVPTDPSNLAHSFCMYCTGQAKVVDLSQDQQQQAGPSAASVGHSPVPGLAQAESKEHEQNVNSSDKKRRGRPPRSKQNRTQDADAMGKRHSEAGLGQQEENKFHRSSRSGIEVEMEEI